MVHIYGFWPAPINFGWFQRLRTVLRRSENQAQSGRLPANKSRNFLKYSRFPNREGQYVEESKWGFQYVEEYQSSTYWLVFLDLLANH